MPGPLYGDGTFGSGTFGGDPVPDLPEFTYGTGRYGQNLYGDFFHPSSWLVGGDVLATDPVRRRARHIYRRRRWIPENIFGKAAGYWTIAKAQGGEIDLLYDAADDVRTQMFVASANSDWGLQLWEDLVGITPDPTLTDDERRIKIYEKLIRTDDPAGTELEKLVMRVLKQNVKPKLFISPGKWVVVKPTPSGFPSNFHEVEDVMRKRTSAHLGAWLAPHDIINGLTLAQMDKMHIPALDVLTLQEIGGKLTLGYTLGEMDGLSLATLNGLTLEALDGTGG